MQIRSLIQHNIWLKVFSLVLAMLTWFAVQFMRENDIKFSSGQAAALTSQDFAGVPVSVLKNPTDVRVYHLSPQHVAVRVVGEAAILRGLNQSDLKVFIDTTERIGVQESYAVKVNMPHNMMYIVTPAAVRVTLGASQSE